MPLDSRVQRLLGALAAGNAGNVGAATVAQRRQGLADLLRLSGTPAAVERIDSHTLPGPAGPIAVRLYVPPDEAPGGLLGPGLLYLHGGGFVAGSLDTHDGIARWLANLGGCRVVSVDYRLAPEHQFPAAFEDACAALAHLVENAESFGIDRHRLGVCGDSAGGTLAAAACHASRVNGSAPVALLVLLCPILDYGGRSDSRRDLAHGYLLDEDTLAHDLWHYLPPGADPADERLSPLRAADLSGMPRTVIHSAEYDPLRDEARAYADRLAYTGVAVSYVCHPGMIHLFYGLGGVVPYARVMLTQVGDEIRSSLARPDTTRGERRP